MTVIYNYLFPLSMVEGSPLHMANVVTEQKNQTKLNINKIRLKY